MYKNTCIIKILLNVVCAGIEELLSRNKFLNTCVKGVCRLRTWALSLLRNTKMNYKGPFRTKAHGMLTCCIVAFHDYVRPHTTINTRALLEHFSWELFDDTPYSSDYTV
jgi:hypothetical protein